MKIITWNCNMAFRKKADFILEHQPDILVIPECEDLERLIFAPGTPVPTSKLWVGKNKHKGLGIFSYGNYTLQKLDCHCLDFQLIVPVLVKSDDLEFNLIAIWANNPADRDGRYVEQIWKSIHHYDDLISERQTILTGDFNSNTIWDKEHGERSHSGVVKLLEAKKIYSTYHLHHKKIPGAEDHPTLYMYRKKEKPYHIDYCFASSGFTENIISVEVGDYEYWSKFSDHVPLMVSFDICKILEHQQIVSSI